MSKQSKDGNLIKFDDLRIRKVAAAELPFFRRHPDFVRGKVFVVDAFKRSIGDASDEKENKTHSYMTKQRSGPTDEDVAMEGLEIVGEPLEVSMLSESRLDQADANTPAYKGYHSGIAEEAAELELNALPVAQVLQVLSGFENSDTIRRSFLEQMDFGDKAPNNYTTIFVALADNATRRTAALVTQRVDKMSYNGTLHNNGVFDDGVRAFISFNLSAKLARNRLRSINYHSIYNALCNSQLITPMPKWPQFKLRDREILFEDEQMANADTNVNNEEFVPGLFSVRTTWVDNLIKPTADAMQTNKISELSVHYFDKPGGLRDAEVTVKPGWLDTRVKGFDRTVHIRFLMYLCDCLQKTEIVWPSQREQPQIMEQFRLFVSNLSTVETKKDSYDFVEGLWDFLSCCRSFASIRAILNETYDYFSRGVLTSKYVHVDNCSSIALIIKTMDRANAVLPRLDTWTCVQMMIEVGIDRIRRDLIDELVNKRRLPASSFAESLKINPSLNVDERVRVVLTMHLVLQSINLINEFVTIQAAEMQKIFNLLLYQFSHVPMDKLLNESFSFSTKVCNIESFVLQTCRLREWAATHEFADKSGVASWYTIQLTRFNEFKRLAKQDAQKRYRAIDMPVSGGGESATGATQTRDTQKPADDRLYWNSFDCCTYARYQLTAGDASKDAERL